MSNSPRKVDFGKELKELEAIVEWFETGDVDLDQALPKFERGMELVARLREHLNHVQNEVEVIKKKFNTAAKPTKADIDDVSEDSEPPSLLG